MFEKIKSHIKKYYQKKSIFSIVIDFVFVILLVLLINPGTRKDISVFFIRLTSFPPSTLNTNEQYEIGPETRQWVLTDISGKQLSFSSLLDKPVLLNIWATWCPPCLAELPGLLNLRKEYGTKASFVFVTDENRQKVKKFLQHHGYDPSGFYFAQRFPSDFATSSIPASFIVSPVGKVVLQKKGAARWNTGKVKHLLDKLIAGGSR